MRFHISKSFLFCLLLTMAVLAFPRSAEASVPDIFVHLTNTYTGGGVSGVTFTERNCWDWQKDQSRQYCNGNENSRSRTTDSGGTAFFDGGPCGEGSECEKFGCGDNDQLFTITNPLSGTVTEYSYPGICHPLSGERLDCGVGNDTSYVIYYSYTPPEAPLTLSCSASPAIQAQNQTVNWSSTPGGGTGSYSYSWVNLTNAAECPNGSSVQNPACSAGYPTVGVRNARVTVTSGSQTQQCNPSVIISPPAYLKTTSGDVHTNSNINTPGGP